MTADTIGAVRTRCGSRMPAKRRDVMPGDMTRGGLAASAALHLIVAALVVFGLPNLFRKPPPQDMPIAVQLVTIAPETRATHAESVPPAPRSQARAAASPSRRRYPNRSRNRRAEPGSASRRRRSARRRLRRRSPRRNRFRPIRRPCRKPKPKPLPAPPAAEAGRSARAARPAAGSGAQTQAETRARPGSRRAPRRSPKPGQSRRARPEAKKTDPAAFSKLLQDLERRRSREKGPAGRLRQPAEESDRQQTARAEEPTPAPRRTAALSPPSSQPKAPLGTELTASEIDIVRQQLARCWNIPAGARDAKDLVVTIRGSIAPDGRCCRRRSSIRAGSATRFSAPRRKARAAPSSIRSVRRCVCRRKNTKRGRRSRSS